MDLKESVIRTYQNFSLLIRENIHTRATSTVGFTMIGIKSKISGKLEIHTFVLMYPFCCKDNVIKFGYNQYYPNIHEDLYMIDFELSVDVSFYEFMYKEMKNKNNILLGRILEDNWSWELSSGAGMILVKNNNFVIAEESLEEWMEKKEFDLSTFSIEIINPNLYSVPFPLKNLHFSLNQTSKFLKTITIT
jgi:hypothetical protein